MTSMSTMSTMPTMLTMSMNCKSVKNTKIPIFGLVQLVMMVVVNINSVQQKAKLIFAGVVSEFRKQIFAWINSDLTHPNSHGVSAGKSLPVC